MKLAALAFALGISAAAGVLAQTGPAANFGELSASANAAREASNIPQAIDLYRKAIALRPNWEQGLWFLGTLEYDSNQYSAGRDDFRRLVGLNAKATPAWALLGLCEFETGDYTRSLADIQRAISLGAAKESKIGPVLLDHEALLLTRAGHFNEAVQKFTKLVRFNEIDRAAVPAIGLAALRVRLLPKEIPAARQGLYAAAGKAAVYIMAADYPHAEQAFQELLQQYPTARNVHYMYGIFLLVKDPNKAIRELKRELTIDPGNADALTMLAWALLNRRDSQTALPYAEKAAAAAPDSHNAQYVCGRALVETGSVRHGLQFLERAEKMDPKDLEIHVMLAVGYSKARQPVKAREQRNLSLAMVKKDAVHVAHQ
ncbi:MAG: tetratricopeptide repeat protein [Bryobacteraceae bacterium]